MNGQDPGHFPRESRAQNSGMTPLDLNISAPMRRSLCPSGAAMTMERVELQVKFLAQRYQRC
jgi:hypothetical protein